MGNPLQAPQNRAKKNWLEGSEMNSFYSGLYQSMNMMPYFVPESNTQYGKAQNQMFVKRPPLNWNWTFTNIPVDFRFSTAISISSVYGIIIAAYTAMNGDAYILQHNVLTRVTTTIGTIAITDPLDFIWISEVSQVSGGALSPAFVVNVMTQTYTSSNTFYAVSSGGVFTASSLIKITSTNYPSNQTPALICVGKMIYKDGTNYIATLDGRIWNSVAGGNDVTTWTSSSGVGSINTNQYPDQCLGLERYKQHIVAFGSNSIEFFEDVGTVPGPLARLEQAFIKFGVIAPNMFANFDDIIYWLGYGLNNALGVWKLDGYQPIKLSNTGIDALLDGIYSATPTAQMSCGIIRGKKTIAFSGISYQNSLLTSVSGLLPQALSNQGFTGWDTLGLGQVTSLMLNIDDTLWWSWCTSSHTPFSGIFLVPEMNVAYQSGSPPNTQYVFYFYDQTVPVSSYIYNGVYYLSNKTNTFVDTFDPAANVGYRGLYVASINTNFEDFETTNYKRVDQFSLMRTSYSTAPKLTDLNSLDTNKYCGILFAFREPMELFSLLDTSSNTNFQGSAIKMPQNFFMSIYALPPQSYGSARTTFNRLGLGRSWSFMYAESSSADLRTSGYELQIQQYQH